MTNNWTLFIIKPRKVAKIDQKKDQNWPKMINPIQISINIAKINQVNNKKPKSNTKIGWKLTPKLNSVANWPKWTKLTENTKLEMNQKKKLPKWSNKNKFKTENDRKLTEMNQKPNPKTKIDQKITKMPPKKNRVKNWNQ